ncbi:MAG: hypothetical protein AB7F72_10655 [Afipia sp.]
MLTVLQGFVLGLVTPVGGALLVIALALSSLMYFRAQHLRTRDWLLAAVFNIPTAILFITAAIGAYSQLLWIYLVIGYGLGGFGVGWILGLLLCLILWKIDKKEDLAAPKN